MTAILRRLAAVGVLVCAAAVSWSGEASLLRATPLFFEGRPMPLESAARIVLYRFAGRVRIGEESAVEWYVRLLTDPFSAVEDRVFLVDDPAVLDAVGISPAARGRYRYLDIHPHRASLIDLATGLSRMGRPLDRTETAIVALAHDIGLFEGVASTLDPFRTGSAAGDELPGSVRLIPIVEPGGVRWVTPETALAAPARWEEANRHVPELLAAWSQIAAVRSDNSEARFRIVRALAELEEDGVYLGPIGWETVHTRTRPASTAAIVAAAGAAAALVVRRLRRSHRWARAVTVVTALLLSAEAALRIVVTARPPVTDLPSSFLAVAWIGSILAGVAAWRDRDRSPVALAVGSVGVVLFVGAAGLLRGGADEFAVVQAVLDTNLWLTVHVLVIVAGYASVLAAGALAHVSLAQRAFRRERGARRRSTIDSVASAMHTMNLVGLTLTVIGTVMGGVWAERAWGRFWGWDPKENGALLIILWVSIAVHSRRMRSGNGTTYALLTACGTAVVLFSWLGVNLMGVGLHAYGFSSGSWVVVVAIAGLEVVVVAALFLRAKELERDEVERPKPSVRNA